MAKQELHTRQLLLSAIAALDKAGGVLIIPLSTKSQADSMRFRFYRLRNELKADPIASKELLETFEDTTFTVRPHKDKPGAELVIQRTAKTEGMQALKAALGKAAYTQVEETDVSESARRVADALVPEVRKTPYYTRED